MTIIQLNPRQLKIIDIVKENEPITSESIASILNVTRATLRSDLAILTMTGILDARPKVGYFYSGISGASLVGNKIKDKKVKVNNKIEKAKYAVKEDDHVVIEIPAPKLLEIVPQNIPIDIVYEDDDLLIVNKPQDMVVHPAPGNYEGTLVNAILYHCKENLSSINGVIRPGIVHRIDKDTSGLLMIAKNNNAHNSLAEQLKEHSITREYQFICHGVVKEDKITVNKPIGRNPKDRLKMAVVKDGKNAITHFEVIKRYENFTHMKARLETGRTHQIRVHALSINQPLLGDEVYGPKNNKFKLKGQTLHAKKLGFIHPTTKEYVEFDSELPKYFQDILNKLK